MATFCLSMAACHPSDLDPMEIQPKFAPYRESDFFDDGRAMRVPPPGTIPRERIIGNPALTEGIVGGQAAARIPLPVTAELLRLGQRRFEITCATCHGVLGDGDSEVARKMSLRPPPSLAAYADQPPGVLFRVISTGYGLMPAYGVEIPAPERWAVVAYVRALARSQRVPLDQAPPAVRQQLMQEQEAAP